MPTLTPTRPLPANLASLRDSCRDAGITAESPDHLTPEDRRLYREEGQN